MLIAKEGLSIILGLFLVSAGLFRWLPIVSGVFLLLALFSCFFFRDPIRALPTAKDTIFSPADGTVFEINKTIINGKEYHHIVIFLSVFNVHINRIPLSGKIIKTTFYSGKFLAAYKKGIETQNQRQETDIETPFGLVRMVQITGAIARRIVCRLTPEQKVQTGEKFGLIKFGSRTDLYFPISGQLLIQNKQKLNAGITAIANFK